MTSRIAVFIASPYVWKGKQPLGLSQARNRQPNHVRAVEASLRTQPL
jgi:hypothetical protein